jgi:hypothetical protein
VINTAKAESAGANKIMFATAASRKRGRDENASSQRSKRCGDYFFSY